MVGIVIVILLIVILIMLVELRNILLWFRDCGGLLYINSFVKFFVVLNNLNLLS